MGQEGAAREGTLSAMHPTKALKPSSLGPFHFLSSFLSQERETKMEGERKSTLNLLAKKMKIWEMAEVAKCKINPQSWLALAVNARQPSLKCEGWVLHKC